MTPDQFIRKVCHDLRAPLRAMQEIPAWLHEDLALYVDPLPDDIAEHLDMLAVQASRLELILIGLSELAKIVRTQIDPVTYLDDLRVASQFGDSLNCTFNCASLPMEQSHVEAVCNHLADNAVKHGAATRSPASLLICRRDDYYAIMVRDYGPGISEEHRSAIYDPLYTLQPRDDCEGSGMGLAIVKRIADIYGGSCNIQSNNDGQGITSVFTVPVRSHLTV